jgi:hypothetical protein
VTSIVTRDFLDCFRRLPEPVKAQARRAYGLWRGNPQHPSLRFKRVHQTEPIYSVRVGLDWRALGTVENQTITWFWIGSHAEYDRIIG